MRTRGRTKSLIWHLGVNCTTPVRLLDASLAVSGSASVRMILRTRMTPPLPSVLEPIIAELRRSGYRALVVGGAVRDAVLGHAAKDIDIEVYGIAYDRL